ncbi:hypothetical protein ACFE04_026432 [Oxalis oulophora]
MGRSPCCEKAHINKGAWTREEDERLIAYIQAHGEGCWRSLPKAAGLLRCGKSCRLRWINYLRPDLKRGNFTEEEDELIIKLHSLLGNKWSLIAGNLPGRTDNEIKNYWNTHIRRKLISRGIEPSTHKPVNEATCTIKTNSNVMLEDIPEEDQKPSLNPNPNPNPIVKESYSDEINLELRISPPQGHDHHESLSCGDRKLVPCLYCSLGLRVAGECRCRNGGLDYTSLELK